MLAQASLVCNNRVSFNFGVIFPISSLNKQHGNLKSDFQAWLTFSHQKLTSIRIDCNQVDSSSTTF